MPLFDVQQLARKGLEPQIRGVRMGQREQILGVEVAGLREPRIDERAQEVSLEGSVVGDDAAAVEGRSEPTGDFADLRRDVEVVVAG